MSNSDFTQLHLHSQYSLLDGAIKIKDLIPRVLELGAKSVAVTDHGNLFGVIDFYKQAKAAGVKPIIGVETYVCNDRFDRTHRRNHHLILLAKNNQGYDNLRYLNSMAFVEGFYYHPRIDKKILKEHSTGLIGLSACLGGEMAASYFDRGMDGPGGAKETALEYASLFDPGAFYLEVQPNGLPKQNDMNAAWSRLSQTTGIGLVATGDCHYIHKADARAHDILMAIQTNKDLTSEQRLTHGISTEYYIKSAAEFSAYFKDMPQAMENAAAIAASCNVELKLGKPMLPTFQVPLEYTAASYFAHIAHAGLEDRIRDLHKRGIRVDPDQYKIRLAYEIEVITKMDFCGYFTIVWDFIKWAKDRGIPVGPGRGSGAGSLVAYALRITDLDPIRWNLMFERFLNPDRVSMPDFDIDLCQRRRGEVIDYVRSKYGHNSVASIATFTTMSAKSGISAVGKVFGLSFEVCKSLTAGLPDLVAGHAPSVEWALENNPGIKIKYETDPQIREVLDIAKALDGLTKNTGVHAAGIVISRGDLWTAGVPVLSDRDTGSLITQFGMNETEAAGLVKFDFLGLKTLTVIDLAVKMIRQSVPDFDLEMIPLDDTAVFEMISRGDTTGVFQLIESQMRELLRKLKPNRIQDIFAVTALYRPGPIEGGMIPDFIDRKHGRKPVVHLHPALADILADTYGVIVYQEQVMKIAVVLAGFTLAQADNLRRVMGKKKREAIDAEKVLFIAGCRKVGICDEATADKICELIAVFAGYGFNYSHSAAYGMIAYQTAYLKHHYPAEFLAATASCDQDKEDKLLRAIAEIRQAGIPIAGPDVNRSGPDFTIEVSGSEAGPVIKTVRLGLGSIKGVGDAAMDAILAGRTKGPYKSLYDFADRVDTRRCGKKAMELLIDCGAFDRIGIPSRAAAIKALDSAVASGAKARTDKAAGQISLLSMFGSAKAVTAMAQTYPAVPEMPTAERLKREKEALGFFLSGHPLDAVRDLLVKLRVTPCALLSEIADRTEVRIAGVVTAWESRVTKSGKGTMAKFKLEDAAGSIEVVVFPNVYTKTAAILTGEDPVYLVGTLVSEGEEDQQRQKLLLREVKRLQDVPVIQDNTPIVSGSELQITVDTARVTRAILDGVYGLLSAYPPLTGDPGMTVVLNLICTPAKIMVQADLPQRTSPTQQMIAGLTRIVGAGMVKVKDAL